MISLGIYCIKTLLLQIGVAPFLLLLQALSSKSLLVIVYLE